MHRQLEPAVLPLVHSWGITSNTSAAELARSHAAGEQLPSQGGPAHQ